MAEKRRIHIKIEPSKEDPEVWFDVYTDLDPDIAEALIVDTFQNWVEFALGRRSLKGRKLKRPSGAYASSLKLVKRSNTYYEMFSTSPIGNLIEMGRSAFNLGESMLEHGTMKIGKNGEAYKNLYLKNMPASAGKPFVPSRKQSPITQNSRRSWSSSITKQEINARKGAKAENGQWRRISTAHPWRNIPAMPAYHPADYLSEQLREKLTKAERNT